jgi:hypothetical protein
VGRGGGGGGNHDNVWKAAGTTGRGMEWGWGGVGVEGGGGDL